MTPEKTPHWGLAIDTERCIGCHACSVACKVENSVYLGMFRTKVYYHDFHGKNAAGKVTPKRAFLPALCMQCEDAPCLKACPTESIRRDAIAGDFRPLNAGNDPIWSGAYRSRIPGELQSLG